MTQLVQRIADQLSKSPTSAVLRVLMREAQEELQGFEDSEKACRDRSIDPVLSAVEARKQRDAADDFAHEVRRLKAAIERIELEEPKVRAAEHRAAIMPAYQTYKKERQQFIERLRDRYPKVAAEMVELLEGIQKYRQPGVEIPDGEDPLRGDVELEARKVAQFWTPAGFIPQLCHNQIAAFDPTPHSHGLAWSRARATAAI